MLNIILIYRDLSNILSALISTEQKLRDRPKYHTYAQPSTKQHFFRRSVSYNNATGTCELSNMDRITVAGGNAFLSADGYDYMENNCVEEPTKLCEFKKLNGRILKTVDSVYQDVGSVDECRELCLNSPYRCHSYDYGDTGEMVCRLSHHSRATLSDIQVSDFVGFGVLFNTVTQVCKSVQFLPRKQLPTLFANQKTRNKVSPYTEHLYNLFLAENQKICVVSSFCTVLTLFRLSILLHCNAYHLWPACK